MWELEYVDVIVDDREADGDVLQELDIEELDDIDGEADSENVKDIVADRDFVRD